MERSKQIQPADRPYYTLHDIDVCSMDIIDVIIKKELPESKQLELTLEQIEWGILAIESGRGDKTLCYGSGDYIVVETALGQLFIKKKTHSGLDNIEIYHSLSGESDYGFSTDDEINNFRAGYYARSSIISELSLADDISEVISSPEAQSVAAKYGFCSVEFIPPLLALVNRTDGLKYSVYPYHDIVPFAREDFYCWYEDLAEGLKDLLAKHGIIADDLYVRHLACSSDGRLFLFDAEEYRRS